jgi:hypothetical protein
MGGWSFYGTGLRIHGLEPEPPDCVVLTQWLTLFFIPIAPLRRAKCRYHGEAFSDGHTDAARRFELVERLPLSWSSVCATYLWSWAALLATIGPVACLIWRTNGRAATVVEMIALFAFIAALALMPFFVERRQKKLLEASWQPDRREAQDLARRRQAAAVLTAWQSKHVLSERTFLLAGVLGLVPGVAAAVWWEWGGNVLKIAGIVSAVLTMGAVYLVDRVLVRQRDAAKAPPKGDW